MTGQNSLGIECYQQLVILGYWKKAIFQIDFNGALDLASAFGDFHNYKIIFLSYSEKYKHIAKNRLPLVNSQKIDFSCLPFEVPESPKEIDMAIICLEHYIDRFLFFRDLTIPTQDYFINRFYRQEYKDEQFHSLLQQNPQFPDFFMYTSKLLNFFIENYKGHEDLKGYQIFNTEKDQNTEKRNILSSFLLYPKRKFLHRSI